MKGGSFRLYDFDRLCFVGPRETRTEAEKRKSRITAKRRDHQTNWFRIRVHPVKVATDGTITFPYRRSIEQWRKGFRKS